MGVGLGVGVGAGVGSGVGEGVWDSAEEAVDAPIINELPVTLECELVRIDETNGDFAIYGKVKSVSVRDDVLNEKNQLDLEKCQFITYNSCDNSYRLVSTKVADAFRAGLKLR